ncbi:unnamed protein product [Litomosoides sigmodontis]|uniref:Transthyretin-like family protein n=1 Tax=Litomosoides sigmodontis TaxID=42156 RepID=A0A3P7JL33_LITSI|nr:unnamed protein product [Litomosoides sigmodontis]
MLRFWLEVFAILSVVARATHAYRIERMVQSTAVRGKFICGEKPAVGVRIKLFEDDFNPLNGYSQPVSANEYMTALNPDDVLNQTYTDEDGQFFVHGTTVEVTQIQPILKVYHTCLHNGLPGLRKIHFLVPRHFTNYGTHAERVLDIGIFNLEAVLPDEEYESYVE